MIIKINKRINITKTYKINLIILKIEKKIFNKLFIFINIFISNFLFYFYILTYFGLFLFFNLQVIKNYFEVIIFNIFYYNINN